MKKTNNKYRNNNNNYNQIYSLNYKFDSISAAGKVSGTALDLIKRYNELAKEAHGNGDYVEAEVFRQYAEHYRKIVTEINERKNMQRPVAAVKENEAPAEVENAVQAPAVAETASVPAVVEASPVAEAAAPAKREFKIIEISPADAKSELISGSEEVKAPKVTRPRRTAKSVAAAAVL